MVFGILARSLSLRGSYLKSSPLTKNHISKHNCCQRPNSLSLTFFFKFSERHYEAFRLRRKDGAGILSVVPGTHHQSAKVIFDDNHTVDFKYIWVSTEFCNLQVISVENTVRHYNGSFHDFF